MIERKYSREWVHSVEVVRHTLNIRIYYNYSSQLLLLYHQILLDPKKSSEQQQNAIKIR